MARYTLIVGTRNWSSWSLRPYVALKATGAPFEMVDIRLRQTERPTTREQILKHSPAGKVPVLKIEEDGKAADGVGQSGDLRDPGRAPSRSADCGRTMRRARAMARSYAGEMHSGFPDLRDQLTMDFARKKAAAGIARRDQSADRAHPRAWEQRAGRLRGRISVRKTLRRRLHVCAGGVALSSPMAWTCRRRCSAYMDRMMALPAMQDWGEGAQRRKSLQEPRLSASLSAR